MALGHYIDRLQEREAGRPDLATIGTIGSICNQIYAEFALGTFHHRVGSARRHVIAFGEELEVVDQRFHRPLHLRSVRRREFAVLHLHRTWLHPVQTLPDDLHALAHFGETHQIAVVAIAITPDRDLKLYFGIFVIGLRASQIPRQAART